MLPPQHLRVIRFTADALLVPEISSGLEIMRGVEYVESARNVEAIRAVALRECVEPFESDEPIGGKPWDGATPLDGKSCLFVANGGAGDSLAHTALVAAFKRRFPRSRWTVASHADTQSGIWMFNPNIEGRRAIPCPVPRACYESFDHHFLPENLTYQNRDREQGSWYDTIFEWAHLGDAPPEWKRPMFYIFDGEPEQSARLMFPFYDWAKWVRGVPLPGGYAVIQINTSKLSRNMPHEFWFPIIRGLLDRIPRNPVVLIGEGRYAVEFAERLRAESFHAEFRGEGLLYPPIVASFADMSAVGGIGVVEYRVRRRGDLSAGKPLRISNPSLNIRGIAPIVRAAAVCITGDSMMAHLCGARSIGVPCVSLFGPFAPEWRVSSYPNARPIHKPEACPLAPCAFHDEGLPHDCPARLAGRTWCDAMTAITPQDVLVEVDKFLEKRGA